VKSFILCGGMGTRLGVAKNTPPKALIKIGSEPILIHLIKIYLKNDINVKTNTRNRFLFICYISIISIYKITIIIFYKILSLENLDLWWFLIWEIF
jgi:choline kinase